MHACIRMLVAGVIALAVVAISTGTGVAAGASGNGAAHGSDRAQERRHNPSDTAAATTDEGDTATTGTSGASGDVDEPQPLSTADTQQGGANGDCPGGPYCSTRDGSPSANGAGDGKAIGKPCAGCVGKADNKNPHGQLPNGSDRNAGYECDRNQGVGKGNPAHTGCVAPVEEPLTEPLTEQPPLEQPPVEQPPAEEPPVEITTGGVLPPVEATTGGPLPGKPVAAAQPRTEAAGVLPATGSPAMLGGLLLAGLALVGTGAILLLRRAHG